jgi:hypothetical protein
MSRKIESENEKIEGARRMLAIAASSGGVGMTCGTCGHFDAFDRFISTPVFGQLPRDTFQCPACGVAVQRQHGKPTVYKDGFVSPGPVSLVTVSSMM